MPWAFSTCTLTSANGFYRFGWQQPLAAQLGWSHCRTAGAAPAANRMAAPLTDALPAYPVRHSQPVAVK